MTLPILALIAVVLSIGLLWLLNPRRRDSTKIGDVSGSEGVTMSLETEERQTLVIVQKLLALAGQSAKDIADLKSGMTACCTELNGKLDQILAELAPPLPVAFTIEITTISKENNIMANAKRAKLKVVLLDNGTAKATATPVDSVGIATTLPSGTSVPVWTASDPGVAISPDPTDTSGLTAIFGPASPPVLVASFTVGIDATLPDGTTHVSGTSEVNSIVAGGPAGFQVAVA